VKKEDKDKLQNWTLQKDVVEIKSEKYIYPCMVAVNEFTGEVKFFAHPRVEKYGIENITKRMAEYEKYSRSQKKE